jgi:hypothetical protein
MGVSRPRELPGDLKEKEERRFYTGYLLRKLQMQKLVNYNKNLFWTMDYLPYFGRETASKFGQLCQHQLLNCPRRASLLVMETNSTQSVGLLPSDTE